jgi:hypothetical protein
MARLFWLLLILTSVVTASAYGQSCNPAAVNYIVRDEKGNVLSMSELKILAEQVPKQIGDASTSVEETSFRPDNMTFYWPEDVDWAKGTKVPTLSFSNSGACALRFNEVTLTRNNARMRLVFDLEILRFQNDRRPVIDGLPFQKGTFRLDLSGWAHDPNKMIEANRWKRLRVR